MNIRLTPKQIADHLHDLSPEEGKSKMVELRYSIDPSSQRIDQIEIQIEEEKEERTRSLRFKDVWTNSLPGSLSVPEPIGCGILVVDVQYLGWENPILVVSDDDNQQVIFGASEVEEELQQVGSLNSEKPGASLH